MKLPSPPAAVPRCAAGRHRGTARCGEARYETGAAARTAAIWLLDGVLQYQSFMYTKAFGQMLAGTADGNPSVIARPINWDADLVEHHLVLINTIFATIQLLLGLGIAFRPTVRLALGASIAWAIGVWWFGEGLGGILNGVASPLERRARRGDHLRAASPCCSGPPIVIMSAPFVAARAVGAQVARALWLVLWLSLAYFALTPANRAPQALNGMIAGMESGQPGWLSAIDRGGSFARRGPGTGRLDRARRRPRGDRHRRLPADTGRQRRPWCWPSWWPS